MESIPLAEGFCVAALSFDSHLAENWFKPYSQPSSARRGEFAGFGNCFVRILKGGIEVGGADA